jgi:hypothetical protein
MPSMARYLYILGSIPFLLLGGLHFVYSLMDTVTPRKIVPRDRALIAQMQASTLRITKETDVWRAWLGFNLSHGLGVFFFGFVYLALATQSFALLQAAPVLLIAAPVIAIVYVVLSVKYFFRVPAMGSAVGAVCFLVGLFFAQ